MFALALWDCRAPAARARARPLRDQAALLPRPPAACSRSRPSSRPCRRGEVDLDALAGLPRLQLDPRAATRSSAGRASCRPATCSSGRSAASRASSATRAPSPAAATEAPRRRARTSWPRSCRARLRDSVRAHLVADVPVGVLLSGGVDSARARGARRRGELGAACGRSRSASRSARSTSSADARLVAERYGTDHHELVLRPDAAELLPALAEAFDEPFADSSALPTYLVVEARGAAREGGALRRGRRRALRRLPHLRRRPAGAARRRARAARPARSSSACRARRAKASFDYRAKRFVRAAHLPPLERHHGWKEIFSPDARAELVEPTARTALDPVDVLRARYAETAGAEPLARLQDVDLGIYLVDDLLVKTDRASMAHSLEARVPFLDPVVAELRARAPDAAQGARPREEAPAAQGGRAAPARRDRPRPQARLLDPGGGLAARRARALRRATSSPRTGCAARASSTRTR